MSDQLINDLRFYGTTLNECPNFRSLLKDAGDEIERLRALAGAVTCFDCKAPIDSAGEWYRCFDCDMHLCRNCVKKHFGETYSPHHRRMASLGLAVKA